MRSTPWSRLSSSTIPRTTGESRVRSVCIIGAGSSGLVAAKHLTEAGFDVAIFEKGAGIGGTFVTKSYDEAGLVSSKYLTAFSDLRSPETDPSHLSLPQYVEYLKTYADQYGLWRFITFGASVESVVREESHDKSGKYTVRLAPIDRLNDAGSAAPYPVSETMHDASRLEGPITRHFDAVCVCSGLHEAPYIPPIAGLSTFSGERVLHSSEYKDRGVFANKRVLVIGCGETGMDLAYRAVQVASHTALSIKNGFLSVPHEGWGGTPLDTLIANLFEHAYEHQAVHDAHLKWKFTTVFIQLGFLLMTGSRSGYNQWVGGLREIRRGYHILCKSTAAMPYLNRPAKQRAWWYSWLWRWAEPPVDKSIESFPAPIEVKGNTVYFGNGRTFDADIIALATGYRQTFPFLHAHDAYAAADGHGAPPGSAPDATAAPPPPTAVPPPQCWKECTGARGSEDRLPGEHFIISPDEPTLAFIGFVRPNVGAIPPMAEMQVMWWIRRLQGHCTQPTRPPSYMLLGKKLTYGVDYGNYMHQLAAEIGAAPTVGALIWRPRVLIAWALGQAYIVFFRLVGPFATQAAWEVAANELYQPIVRRPLFTNVILIFTMLLFGYVNLLAHAMDKLKAVAAWPFARIAGGALGDYYARGGVSGAGGVEKEMKQL